MDNDKKLLRSEERLILERICADEGLPADVVEQIIRVESSVFGMGRRHGIWESLRALVSEGVKRTQTTRGQQ